MMKRAIALRALQLALLLALVPLTELRAGPLAGVDLSLFVQSTVTDTDVILLDILAGQPTGQPALPFSYNSTATDSTWTNWSGTLGGLYLGKALNLGYNGSLSGVPLDTVNWTTSGTFGGSSITGSGTATISYPTLSTYNLTFTDTLGDGTNSITAAIVIPGTFLPDGSFMDGTPGDPEAGAGTFLLNGVSLGDIGPGEWDYHSEPGSGIAKDSIRGIFGHWWDTAGVVDPPTTFNVEFTPVPEPNSLFLFASGLPAMALARRRRKRGDPLNS